MKNCECKINTLYESMDILERFILKNNVSIETDYGSGTHFHMVEIHMLTSIARNPGITITKLAKDWTRTKGAVSQIVKKLEQKNLIIRENDPSDRKIVKLYVTDEGMVHVNAHIAFDSQQAVKLYDLLKERFTDEQIETFYESMKYIVEKYSPDEAYLSSSKVSEKYTVIKGEKIKDK